MLNVLIKIIYFMPHNIALSFGRFLGKILWLLSFKKVNTAESRCVKSLGIGITNSRKIVKKSFENIGMSAIEFVRLKKIKANLSKYTEFSGLEILQEALSRNKGVILICSHMDNWELAGSIFSEYGLQVTPIYTPQKGYINDFILQQRSKVAGMKMVKSEGAALREIFKTLKSGGIIAILQDLDARKNGVITNFLGIPASTHDGVVKLYSKFHSPVVPLSYLRDKNNKSFHHIKITKILSDENDKNGNPFGQDLNASLEMCNYEIENWIKNNPEQWLWLIDRWEYTFRKGIAK